MEKKYCFLATEGPHDQAAITRLLELLGLKKFRGTKNTLDPFWHGLIPIYPSKKKNGEEDLYARLIMPAFLDSETHSVAVYWGEGYNLIPNLVAITTNNKQYAQDIQAFGLIVDADQHSPDKVAQENTTKLQTIFPPISPIPGLITDGPPRTGIYILPDNTRPGTFDSVLLNCASVIYPDHKKGAEKFIDELDDSHTIHLQNNWCTKEKAMVACIVSIVKPGATNTSSIAQDKWLCDTTLNDVNDVTLLYSFLKDLLELP